MSIYFKHIISPTETLCPKVIIVNNLNYKVFYMFTCVYVLYLYIYGFGFLNINGIILYVFLHNFFLI